MSKYDKKEVPLVPSLEEDVHELLDTTKDVEFFLEDIEVEHGVEILFATMVGSQVYGYNHKSSDINIRFVYKKPMDEYLHVCWRRDTIKERNYPYDMVGWDLKRFLHQHYLSNPLVYEWVNSPVRYGEDLIRLDELMMFDKNILCKRFYQVAQHNFNKAHKEIPYMLKFTDVKRYIYAIRYILMWNMLKSQKKSPPVTFKELLMGNKQIGAEYLQYIVDFMGYYRNQGRDEIGYIELSHMNSWINNSLIIMGSTYPLRPPKRYDCYYYDKRFIELLEWDKY